MQNILIPLIAESSIVIKFDGLIDPKRMIRYQQNLAKLLEENVLETRNGKVVLNFDHENRIRELEFSFKKR